MGEANERVEADAWVDPYEEDAAWSTDLTPVESGWFALYDERGASRTSVDLPCALIVPDSDTPSAVRPRSLQNVCATDTCGTHTWRMP